MIRPDGPLIHQPTSPRCAACTAGSHDCAGEVLTGRQVPDRDPYRDRTRLLPEMVACGCDVCAGVAS